MKPEYRLVTRKGIRATHSHSSMMKYSEEFVITATGDAIDPVTWTRGQLKQAVGLAQQVLQRALVSGDGPQRIEVRGGHGEGPTLYEAAVQDNAVRTLKAVSAVETLLPKGPKLSHTQKRLLDALESGESVILFPGSGWSSPHFSIGTGAGHYRLVKFKPPIAVTTVRALVDARVLVEHGSFPCDGTGQRAIMYKVNT